MSRVLLVCGSLRAGSTNEAALRTAHALAPQTTTLFDGLAALPHFNPDDDHDPLPPAVAALRTGLAAHDAVLFCTPEYAGTLPGAFKNLLDWTVGGPEMDRRRVAWINVSGPAAPTGGAGAHDALRTVLGYVGAEVVEAACARIPIARAAVDEDGLVHDDDVRQRVAGVLRELGALQRTGR